MKSTISLWENSHSKDFSRRSILRRPKSFGATRALKLRWFPVPDDSSFLYQCILAFRWWSSLVVQKRLKYVPYREQLQGNLVCQYMRRNQSHNLSDACGRKKKKKWSRDPTSAKTIALCKIVCEVEFGKFPLFKSHFCSCWRQSGKRRWAETLLRKCYVT